MVRLGGKRARDPQFSNADSRPIAQNALEKPYLLRQPMKILMILAAVF